MIRPYSIKDKDELLHILRLNMPRYFDVSEEDDFLQYLDQHAANYFVIEENDKVIGSGGINYFDDDTIARISWDIIHPDFQGRGIGKKLAFYRIDEIKKKSTVRLIVVRTTQLVYKFFELGA